MNNDQFSAAMEEEEKMVHTVRDHFFNDVLKEWSREPSPIDHVMGQAGFFMLPDFASNKKDDPLTIMIKDVQNGVLAVSVTPKESKYPNAGGIRIVYSIMQAGDWLRFGFLLQGDPKLLMIYQKHHDHLLNVESIWDRPCDYQFRDSGGMLIEWRFCEPDFYSNFAIRERFKIIIRHLHFRLGKNIVSLLTDFNQSVDMRSFEEHVEDKVLTQKEFVRTNLIGGGLAPDGQDDKDSAGEFFAQDSDFNNAKFSLDDDQDDLAS